MARKHAVWQGALWRQGRRTALGELAEALLLALAEVVLPVLVPVGEELCHDRLRVATRDLVVVKLAAYRLSVCTRRVLGPRARALQQLLLLLQ